MYTNNRHWIKSKCIMIDNLIVAQINSDIIGC